jgi:hypothetical protein
MLSRCDFDNLINPKATQLNGKNNSKNEFEGKKF